MAVDAFAWVRERRGKERKEGAPFWHLGCSLKFQAQERESNNIVVLLNFESVSTVVQGRDGPS